MKKLASFITGLLLVGLMATLVYAAATGTVKNTDSYYTEGPVGSNYVKYWGVTDATAATDSVGIHYSKALYIAPFAGTTTYALVFLDMYNSALGTEDCNVSMEYSNDLATWVAGAGVIKDQLTTTEVVDTVNVVTGTTDGRFNTFDYMRFKFDYQTGNPTLTYVTWVLRLQKPTAEAFPKRQGHVASSTD